MSAVKAAMIVGRHYGRSIPGAVVALSPSVRISVVPSDIPFLNFRGR